MTNFRYFCFLLVRTVLILYLVLPALPCSAEIYRWQDELGHWHFSDSPTSEAPIAHPPLQSVDGLEARAPSPTRELETAKPHAAPTGSAAPAAASAHEGGMLWRISRDGLTPSHLLGTIHSSDPRVVALRPAVQEALDHAQRFIMEMEMDGTALLAFGAGMMLTDGSDLETMLGADLYNKVLQATTEYGLPEMAVRHLKPWVVMALLSMPKPSPAPVLDMVLHQRAVETGKPTTGLESAQEQLAVFEGLSPADQVAMLKMTMDQLPDLPRLFDQLIQAYAADDLQKLAELAQGYSRQSPSEDVIQRFMVRLNDERNRRMLQRMTVFLEEGNSFIAVGALHLAGPTGLLQLLRERGYTVMSVP